jgi:hypothetical protein
MPPAPTPVTKLRENEAASSTDQAVAYDETDLYAAAFFEEYPPRDQSWN